MVNDSANLLWGFCGIACVVALGYGHHAYHGIILLVSFLPYSDLDNTAKMQKEERPNEVSEKTNYQRQFQFESSFG